MASKPSKREVRLALERHGGVIMHVAAAYNVSRTTVYDWIAKYKLQDVVQRSRFVMHDIAEDNVYRAAIRGDLDISKFILLHMPPAAGQMRWTSRSEITGKDGAPLFAPDVLAILEQFGMTETEAVRQFEQLMREEAAKLKVTADG